MLKHIRKTVAAAAVTTLLSTQAIAGELVINYDGSDPAPKEAFAMVIDKFKAANPDIEVKWNLFDHEGYKTSIRNFLTADAPDVAAWYAGNRMAPASTIVKISLLIMALKYLQTGNNSWLPVQL